MANVLLNALKAGAILAGSEPTDSATDVNAILRARLAKYRDFVEDGRADDGGDLRAAQDKPDDSDAEGPQRETAVASLRVLERVQTILERGEQAGTGDADLGRPGGGGGGQTSGDGGQGQPALGTRDMAELRKLVAIVFRWGTDPLVARLAASLPRKPSRSLQGGARIIDLTSAPQDYDLLLSLTSRLLAILFPAGVQGRASQTFVAATLSARHATDVLRPSIFLAWLPNSLNGDDASPPPPDLRQLTLRLLSILPPSQTIASLGALLSTSPPPAQHVHKTCAGLLSRQLLRPGGVPGLLAALFGEGAAAEPDADAPLEQLEHVARVLRAVPAGIAPQEYYARIVPRTLALLAPPAAERTPPVHKRAAAFALGRMLVPDNTDAPPMAVRRSDIAAAVLLPLLHDPLLHVTATLPAGQAEPDASAAPAVSQEALALTPAAALATLATLLTNTDPAPALIGRLLGPLAPALYALDAHLRTQRVADPALREAAEGLLRTWARAAAPREAADGLWRVVEGAGGAWEVGFAGELRVVEWSAAAPSVTLADLAVVQDDTDANPLGLRPDPAHFARFLKTLGREDVAADVFVRLLESYHASRRGEESEDDPMRTLLYLQLILQMQAQLADTASAANMLKRPAHILTFIKHSLEPAAPGERSSKPGARHSSRGLRVDDLRIVPEEEDEDDVADREDSDDEDAPGLEGVQRGDEMAVTAVNLLLSILEANPDLSARTAPVLNDIFALLEPLTHGPSVALSPLAREARLVLTARLASTSAAAGDGTRWRGHEDKAAGAGESSRETYQRALKLLQDPLLPVRAHGLLLLRELVAPARPRGGPLAGPRLDAAYAPAVLAIFLEAAQDDDSYVFLNAVQGLAAMVDGFGKDVLRGLVDIYARGADGAAGGALSQKDVDVRVRVGEALGQVVRRCGSALPAYVDIVVPPLFAVVRAAHLPTVVRASAVSLLAQCADTSALAILPYAADLAEAMLGLLQLESVRAVGGRRDRQAADAESVRESEPANRPGTDALPTSTSAKLPPLRRAALHFLSLLLRASTTQAYESGPGAQGVSGALARRVKNVLEYVAATDEDEVVRIMAREASEGVVELQRAMILGI